MGAFVSTAAGLAAQVSEYPAARRSDHTDLYFGQKVADPYRWMEEIDSPETRSWVNAERAYTAARFAGMPERQAIHARLKQLWNVPKYGIPEKRAGRMFFTKNDGLQNQAVLYVKDAPDAEPRVLIDPNLLSAEGTVAVTFPTPSDDGSLIGYGLATAGSDWVELHVRDVATAKDLPDVIRWVKFSAASWTHDGKGFFYCRFPEVAKGDKLFGKLSGRQMYYHRLGTEQSADSLVFQIAQHPDWFFGGDVSDDGRYLAISVQQTGKIQNALYYIDLVDPLAPKLGGAVVKLLDAFDARYDFIGSSASVFHVRTTLDAPRGRVVSIDILHPERTAWRTAVPQLEDSIETVVFAGGKFVVATLHDVQGRISVFGSDGTALGDVPLPGIGDVAHISGRSSDPEFFYSFSSFLTPPSIYSRNLETGKGALFQGPTLAFDPSRYVTTEIFYTSRDGTRVPLFITARKGLKLDGKTPAWLYGYGGFNISITPAFAVPPIVWLEMGGLYAQANIRGGGEYGEQWHLAGTKERKQNVFDDFIGAADTLVRSRYTSRDRLLIEGRSNGGLLVGAVLNQRPDLCAVALPGVGVMDMLRFHTFTVGAPWISDYGSSADPDGFKYLRAYSPVHTVKTGVRYPAILVTTGDHDDRVFPAHSFKYAAELQHAVRSVQGSGPVLIRIDSNAGHGGSSGTSPVTKVIDEWSDKLGFAAHFMPKGSLQMPVAP